MQTCSTCGVERPLTDFYPNYRRPGRLTTGWCKPCRRDHDRTPEAKIRRKESYERNKRTDPTVIRRWNLMRVYGLTLEEYEDMHRSQGGVCAICQKPPRGTKHDLYVDHDHACCPGRKSCGKCIRGLLCAGCNSAIGRIDDDPTRLVAYLSTVSAQ